MTFNIRFLSKGLSGYDSWGHHSIVPNPNHVSCRRFFGSFSRAHQVTLYFKKLNNHGHNRQIYKMKMFFTIKKTKIFHRSSTIFEGLGICSSSKIDVSIHFQSRLDFQGKHAASNFFPLRVAKTNPSQDVCLQQWQNESV